MTDVLTGRPELKVLEFIPTALVTQKHTEMLARAEPYSWDGTTALSLAQQIVLGKVWVWEVDKGKGVVLTSLVDRPGWRELFLDLVAGDDMMALAALVRDDLVTIARHYQCRCIGASSMRGGATKVLEALGCKAVSTNYMMEV